MSQCLYPSLASHLSFLDNAFTKGASFSRHLEVQSLCALESAARIVKLGVDETEVRQLSRKLKTMSNVSTINIFAYRPMRARHLAVEEWGSTLQEIKGCSYLLSCPKNTSVNFESTFGVFRLTFGSSKYKTIVIIFKTSDDFSGKY